MTKALSPKSSAAIGKLESIFSARISPYSKPIFAQHDYPQHSDIKERTSTQAPEAASDVSQSLPVQGMVTALSGLSVVQKKQLDLDEEINSRTKKEALQKRVEERVSSKGSPPSGVRMSAVQSVVGAFGIQGELGDKLSGFLNDKITKLVELPMAAIGKKTAEFSIHMEDTAKTAFKSTAEFFSPKAVKKERKLKSLVDRKIDKRERKKEFKVESAHNVAVSKNLVTTVASGVTTQASTVFSPVAKKIGDEFSEVAKHMNKTLKKIKGEGSHKGSGLSPALLARSVIMGTAIGATILPALAAIGPIILAGIAVAIAGAVGVAIGGKLSSALDSAVDSITGGKAKTAGEAVYNATHITDGEKQVSVDKKILDIRTKSLTGRGFTDKEASTIAKSSKYSVISRAGPKAYRSSSGIKATPMKKPSVSSVIGGKTSSTLGKTPGSKLSGESEFEPIIQKASGKYNVPAEEIRAIIQQESNFNPKAVSPTGAQGLMQLMPATATDLGVTDPFDPEQNIMAGTKYYAQQLKKFGDPQLAKAAYNAGPGNVSKAIKKAGTNDPSAVLKELGFKETSDYVQKVSSFSAAQSVGAAQSVSAGAVKVASANITESPSKQVRLAEKSSVVVPKKTPELLSKATPTPQKVSKGAVPASSSSTRVTRVDDMGILLANSMLYQ